MPFAFFLLLSKICIQLLEVLLVIMFVVVDDNKDDFFTDLPLLITFLFLHGRKCLKNFQYGFLFSSLKQTNNDTLFILQLYEYTYLPRVLTGSLSLSNITNIKNLFIEKTPWWMTFIKHLRGEEYHYYTWSYAS